MRRFTRTNNPFLPVVIACTMALVFLADILSPLGVAVWVMYLIPVSLGLMLWRPNLPLMLAALASCLLVAGFFASPEGLAMAVQYAPSAIVLDIGLPDQSGLSVLDRLYSPPQLYLTPRCFAVPGCFAVRDGQFGTRDSLHSADDGVNSETKLQILLVEDHQDAAHLMKLLLKNLGHETQIASTVREAIRIASDRHFDLLISDIGLPDGSGLELMRTLRSKRPIKGIALTGYGMDADIRRSREAGFVAHLTKPVNLDQLQTIIRTTLCQPCEQI